MSELKEKLAAIEHEQWAHWQRYMFNRCSIEESGYLIDKNDVEHWQRQIDTVYAELSEKEKQSDRDQVDRYWDLIPHWIPVVKRLPTDHHPGYLVRGIDNIPHKAYWDDDHWIYEGARFEANAFIDWMEIPE